MTQQPHQCHLYQLFPPSSPPSPSAPSPSSPVDSPRPLTSPSSSRTRVASVQDLLESSFLHAGLKFVEVSGRQRVSGVVWRRRPQTVRLSRPPQAPSCLLLLMPRFGKDFKMFDTILPTLSLDITDLLDDSKKNLRDSLSARRLSSGCVDLSCLCVQL